MTNNIALAYMNLLIPKVGAKSDLLFSKMTSAYFVKEDSDKRASFLWYEMNYSCKIFILQAPDVKGIGSDGLKLEVTLASIWVKCQLLCVWGGRGGAHLSEVRPEVPHFTWTW